MLTPPADVAREYEGGTNAQHTMTPPPQQTHATNIMGAAVLVYHMTLARNLPGQLGLPPYF